MSTALQRKHSQADESAGVHSIRADGAAKFMCVILSRAMPRLCWRREFLGRTIQAHGRFGAKLQPYFQEEQKRASSRSMRIHRRQCWRTRPVTSIETTR